jgi:hypothetical protein
MPRSLRRILLSTDVHRRRLGKALRAVFTRYRTLMCAAIAVAAIMLAWETYLHLKFRTVILVDGQRITVKSRPQTVQKLLTEQGIRLGEKDIVEPALRAAVPRGGLIRIVRVDEKIVTAEEILPFKVLSRKKLEQNLRKVELQKGLYR